MPEQWPRALLRAALREVGYDAVGARDFDDAFRYTTPDVDRGPVGLVVLDQSAVAGADPEVLTRLLARLGNPPTALLARAVQPVVPGPWRRVVRRPVSVANLVNVVQGLLPLPGGSSQPVD